MKRVSPNASALRYALQCDIPPLKQAAVDFITKTWRDCSPQTVTECARRLDVSRNAMSKLLKDLNL